MKVAATTLAIFLAGCASTEYSSALSVQEVQSRQRQLDGQVVLVRGYMVACRTMWCKLSASPGEPGELPNGSESLAIGGEDQFKLLADAVAPAEIILRARVDGAGVPDPATGAIAVRADCCDLQPIEIVRIVRRIDKKFQ